MLVQCGISVSSVIKIFGGDDFNFVGPLKAFFWAHLMHQFMSLLVNVLQPKKKKKNLAFKFVVISFSYLVYNTYIFF